MQPVSLITGVSGHLGNNLLRLLLKNDLPVKGTVRNTEWKAPFTNLHFQPTYADLLNKASLRKALEGVDQLYQVAAVFRHWSPDPQKDIYEANMAATRNVLEAAAEMGVKRIVYVSSIAALDHSLNPMRENTHHIQTIFVRQFPGQFFAVIFGAIIDIPLIWIPAVHPHRIQTVIQISGMSIIAPKMTAKNWPGNWRTNMVWIW